MSRRQYNKKPTPSEKLAAALPQCEAANKELANLMQQVRRRDLPDHVADSLSQGYDQLKSFMAEFKEIYKDYREKKDITQLAARCVNLRSRQLELKYRIAEHIKIN